MGEALDRLKTLRDEETVELSMVQKVKGYFRRGEHGQQVHVSPYTRTVADIILGLADDAAYHRSRSGRVTNRLDRGHQLQTLQKHVSGLSDADLTQAQRELRDRFSEHNSMSSVIARNAVDSEVFHRGLPSVNTFEIPPSRNAAKMRADLADEAAGRARGEAAARSEANMDRRMQAANNRGMRNPPSDVGAAVQKMTDNGPESLTDGELATLINDPGLEWNMPGDQYAEDALIERSRRERLVGQHGIRPALQPANDMTDDQIANEIASIEDDPFRDDDYSDERYIELRDEQDKRRRAREAGAQSAVEHLKTKLEGDNPVGSQVLAQMTYQFDPEDLAKVQQMIEWWWQNDTSGETGASFIQNYLNKARAGTLTLAEAQELRLIINRMNAGEMDTPLRSY